MGKIENHANVKLVIPTLYSDKEKFEKNYIKLINIFGEVDYSSQIFNFIYTDYYNKEMGTPIYRIIFSFKKLIEPEQLPDIKLLTNELEKEEAVDGNRKVNLDPGYIDHPKFILATTKNYSHRIYIGKGIFAECTLMFKKNSFTPADWTYNDYKTSEYIQVFNQIRNIYLKQYLELQY